MTATYKPDGKTKGAVGTLDILVEDGRGGSVIGKPADHRAVVQPPAGGRGAERLRIYPGALGITAADRARTATGSRVTITGRCRAASCATATAILHGGDQLAPQELAR